MCLFACLSLCSVFFFCQLPRFSFPSLRQHISRTCHPHHASKLSSFLQFSYASIYPLSLCATCQVLTIVVCLSSAHDSSSIPAILPCISVPIPHHFMNHFLGYLKHIPPAKTTITNHINDTLYSYHFTKNLVMYPHLNLTPSHPSERYPCHVIPFSFLTCALSFMPQTCCISHTCCITADMPRPDRPAKIYALRGWTYLW